MCFAVVVAVVVVGIVTVVVIVAAPIAISRNAGFLVVRRSHFRNCNYIPSHFPNVQGS